MKYNMYQELVDRINELLKENKKYEELIDSIPTKTLRMLMLSKNDKRKEWGEVLDDRYRKINSNNNM